MNKIASVAAYHDEIQPQGDAGFPSAAAVRRAVLRADRASLPEEMKCALDPEAMMPPLAAKLRTLAYTGADLTVQKASLYSPPSIRRRSPFSVTAPATSAFSPTRSAPAAEPMSA